MTTIAASARDDGFADTFAAGGKRYGYCSVRAAIGSSRFLELPYAARILAENLLRHRGRPGVSMEVLNRFIAADTAPDEVALPLYMPRIILPDSSGIPVLMDLAALRSAVARSGRDAALVKAAVPMTLVVDHSLHVDVAGCAEAARLNLEREFERNHERYRFLKWAQGAFSNLEICPPGSGIIHQVHLEQIAAVTLVDEAQRPPLAYPDLVIGGDSHTPMVSGLGVLGWGVGGIEAEAAALGEPYVLPKPEFVGVRLSGRTPPGVTFTDVVLRLTEKLRACGVVGAFLEFFGSAVGQIAVPDRATLANMAPEYGATAAFWPVDEQTLAYLRLTGRPEAHVELVAAHARAGGLFRSPDAPVPAYDRIIDLDLSAGGRSIAGPAYPHNRQSPNSVAASFLARHPAPPPDSNSPREAALAVPHGAIAIAAITSCTNTANPRGMMCAGLLARNAARRGLRPPPWVKTSFAPGSRAVAAYLQRAGLIEPLEVLGFHVVGYGCTTCGGKSGPLRAEMVEAIERQRKGTVAVLSGNRNFDGRIHRLVAASYLCAPALVVAYALAGRITLDIETDVIATDATGAAVRLADLWPSDAEIDEMVERHVRREVFASGAAEGSEPWHRIEAPRGVLFPWDPTSGYIVEPPFFSAWENPFARQRKVTGVRVLGIYGDGLTTDHISPGGEIPPESPAGRYLQSLGIQPAQFNTYVGRRGNHHVMTRGTYGNVRIRNRMTPEREGWWTRYHPGGEVMSVFGAAQRYAAEGVPLIVIGGRNFGAGSSRDWAAKGPALLGVCAVLAHSFERIHRSNLIGVGIVPFLFRGEAGAEALGLNGSELFSFSAAKGDRGFPTDWKAAVQRSDGSSTILSVEADVRSDAEADLLLRGGMFRAALERVVGARA